MKRNIIKATLIFVVLIGLQSCEGVIDRIYENSTEQNSFSQYQGKYIGTYTGDNNGSLVIIVSEKGSVEITRTSLNSSETYATGLVNAAFNTNNKASSGFYLIGSLNSQMGTWEMNGLKGNWTVKKN